MAASYFLFSLLYLHYLFAALDTMVVSHSAPRSLEPRKYYIIFYSPQVAASGVRHGLTNFGFRFAYGLAIRDAIQIPFTGCDLPAQGSTPNKQTNNFITLVVTQTQNFFFVGTNLGSIFSPACVGSHLPRWILKETCGLKDNFFHPV